MPPWQKPDPARTIAALGAEAEALANTVRRGKRAPMVRELYDVDRELTAKVTNGQTLVYDSSTGKYRPGSAVSATRIVLLNNPAGTLVGGTYHQFSQGWSAGDTSWFSWPATGGYDASYVGLNLTGIYTVTALVFYDAAGGSGFVESSTAGTVAISPVGTAGNDDVSMAGHWVVENLASEQLVRLNSAASDLQSGTIAIQYHGDYTAL